MQTFINFHYTSFQVPGLQNEGGAVVRLTTEHGGRPVCINQAMAHTVLFTDLPQHSGAKKRGVGRALPGGLSHQPPSFQGISVRGAGLLFIVLVS